MVIEPLADHFVIVEVMLLTLLVAAILNILHLVYEFWVNDRLFGNLGPHLIFRGEWRDISQNLHSVKCTILAILIWMQVIQCFIAFAWETHLTFDNLSIWITILETLRHPVRHFIHQVVDTGRTSIVRNETTSNLHCAAAQTAHIRVPKRSGE